MAFSLGIPELNFPDTIDSNTFSNNNSKEMFRNFLGIEKVKNPLDIMENIDSSFTSFLVSINSKKTESKTLFGGITPETITPYIKSVNLPDFGFEDQAYKRGMRTYHNAGDLNLGPLKFTMYNDMLSNNYKFWVNWNDYIISATDNKGRRKFPEEYKVDIIVIKINVFSDSYGVGTIKKRRNNLQVNLLGCYPDNVSIFELDWGAKSEIKTFDINMLVDRMEVTYDPTPGEILSIIDKNLLNIKLESPYDKATNKITNTITKKWKALPNQIIKELKDVGKDVLEDAAIRIRQKINENLPAYLNLNSVVKIGESGIPILNQDELIRRIRETITGAANNFLRNSANTLIDSAANSLNPNNKHIKPVEYTKPVFNNTINTESVINNIKTGPIKGYTFSDIQDSSDFKDTSIELITNTVVRNNLSPSEITKLNSFAIETISKEIKEMFA